MDLEKPELGLMTTESNMRNMCSNKVADPLTGALINNGSEEIGQLQREVQIVSNKCKKIESLLLARDTDITGSLESLFATFRTVSHNQTVLENKLDDALKNQMNTDLMVNSLNERLNGLSEAVGQISKASASAAAAAAAAAQNNGNVASATPVVEQPVSRPTSVRRGPGRPRKSASSGVGSRGSDVNGRQSPPVKVSLPLGNVQVPKSRRYFNDPKVKPEPSKPKEEPLSRQRAQQASVKTAVAANPPPKRKRGRPPKKRIVETVIVPPKSNIENHDEIAEKNGKNAEKREEEEKTEELNDKTNSQKGDHHDGENGNEQDANEDQESLEDDDEDDQDYRNEDADPNYKEYSSKEESPQTIMPPDSKAIVSHASSPSSSRSSLPSQSGFIPSTVATADTTRPQGNDTFDELSPSASSNTTQVVLPAPRKRILGANNDGNTLPNSAGDQSESALSFFAETSLDSAANKLQRELQQRKLDKRRDSREKMLVSMKYNDRQKAKSFMESNKNLLQAMREEERRKRMTALIYDSGVGGAQQATLASSASNSKIPEHIFKLEDKTQNSAKKMGISTMLNGEDFATSLSSPPSPEGPKRRRSFDYFSDEPHTLRQFRRRRAASYLTTPTMAALENPSAGAVSNSLGSGNNVTAGGNGNGNGDILSSSSASGAKKVDSQASLLLASPIELLCKDGFFFRRNTPENPITVGTYLEFKFKPKEEELIGLTVSQKDYADRTRHDRMNAHFLKPEIQAETEFAFQVLRKTTLTEKYVNSLEYFVMEFRWENKLVGLGLKLRESKRTWQRRKALFSLFEFWRDQSREKRGFPDYTMMHAVKEMENYRIFINRSVSWFYNHITLLKMILYDLCDNVNSQWREWMYAKDSRLPVVGQDGVTEDNIDEKLDSVLTLDFLDDGTENSQMKFHRALPISERSTDNEADVDDLDDDAIQDRVENLSDVEK
ncbi:related to Suppressor of mar1-1 protein [Zygosaccharomyces bailii]|nr:related to Suppressor of mar1-1 protein [Zygosaccharomyces bailii]